MADDEIQRFDWETLIRPPFGEWHPAGNGFEVRVFGTDAPGTFRVRYVGRPHLRIDPAQGFGAALIDRTGVQAQAVAGTYAAGETAEAVQDEYGITRHELLLALWHEGANERYGWRRWALEIAGPALWLVYDLDPDAVPLPERDGWWCPACDETYEGPCSQHVRADLG